MPAKAVDSVKKVLILFGTRPEVIKLAPVIAAHSKPLPGRFKTDQRVVIAAHRFAAAADQAILDCGSTTTWP